MVTPDVFVKKKKELDPDIHCYLQILWAWKGIQIGEVTWTVVTVPPHGRMDNEQWGTSFHKGDSLK